MSRLDDRQIELAAFRSAGEAFAAAANVRALVLAADPQ